MLMTTDSSPADAFEALRREVALLRRALEGLAAEQKAQPDYSGVLAGIGARIKEQNAALGAMADAPALQLTPEAMGQQILRASEQVRAQDARLLGHAQQGMTNAAHRMEAVVEKVKTAQEQRRARILAAVVGALFGVIMASIAWIIIGWRPGSRESETPISTEVLYQPAEVFTCAPTSAFYSVQVRGPIHFSLIGEPGKGRYSPSISGSPEKVPSNVTPVELVSAALA